MDIKHIYWFAYFDNSEPSIRYRAVYPLAALKKSHGINYTIIYPGYSPRNVLRFLRVYVILLFAGKENKRVIFQKIHTRRLYAFFLKLLLFFCSDITIYDTDDADYLRFPVDTIYYFQKRCAGCMVGSHALRAHALQYNPNVALLTSPVIDHQRIKSKRNDLFTIGWIGYYNAHRENLHSIFFPALAAIDFDIKLVLLGVTRDEHRAEINAFFSANKYIRIEMPRDIDWENENEVYDHIKEFDLGVAPLIDNEFNRAKSAFKLKQCLSCAVPVLASPVGENNYFLQDGINGYFCNNINDYKNRIHEVKSLSEQDYRALSSQALKSADSFSMQKYCHDLISLTSVPANELAGAIHYI